jgi:competence protein ComEA
VEPSLTSWRILEETGAAAPSAAGSPGATETSSLSIRRTWLLGALAAAAILGLVASLLAGGGADGPGSAGAAVGRDVPVPSEAAGARESGPRSPAASTGPEVVVDVDGGVRRPGLYHLPAGSRIGDAIAAAGGYGPRVDARATEALNLAAKLADGDRVHVPSRDDGGGTPGGATSADKTGSSRTVSLPATPRVAGSGGAGGPLDINSATAAELEALPAIGPATAAKIVAGRPFRSVAELRDRKILGPAALTKLEGLITVR